ncbi:ABC transporter permease [Clostridium paraputrificum]|uniref:ABC transporter permease n=1 Tax=Clostridium paraputrificum TaxID=29363 RepID=UPI00189FDF9D|nr:ABC transporter permease [Clostridium paraputrificum]MDB2092036.1 ABC transporter permease [Clostridium paraputrificum]
MYFKLSLRNIRRSLKDYTIYFLTLVFAVCIFYTFNSIESQKLLLDLSEYQGSTFTAISMAITVVSVFISFILGFLIIYANNFLIKRRKKELGVYMTLGMERKSISRILFAETLLIGFISLGIGLFLGVLLSQCLSIVTAKMFSVKLLSFKFIFSESAFIKTIICFGLIYIIILLFNSRSINKVKLIDLIYASRKNEETKVIGLKISVVLFILSVITNLSAYVILIKGGAAAITVTMFICVILGIIGTFLFFMSLTGFLLKLVQSSKRYYFKKLNMFLLRQINSKINTNFISMSFICLMLFLAICTLSGGLGINFAVSSQGKELTPHDATVQDEINKTDLEKVFMDANINLNKFTSKFSAYKQYNSGIGYKELFNEELVNELKNLYPVTANVDVKVVGLSDFNEEMKLIGKEPIILNDKSFGLFVNDEICYKYINIYLEDGRKINLNNNQLEFDKSKVAYVNFNNTMMQGNIGTIIVNDKYLNGLKMYNSYINLDFENPEDLKILMDEVNSNPLIEKDKFFFVPREMIEANSQMLGTMVAYLGIYLGIIFIITSAAVLALQQLSDSSDNIERYRLLKKIGVDEEEINKTILKQTGIYFMLPLFLAIIHSIVGITFSEEVIKLFGSTKNMIYVIITAIVFIIIYGGYYLATYIGSKNMMKNKI